MRVIPNDTVERAERVLKTDLLSFFVSSPVVGNSHLIDPQSAVRYFCGNFGFESEAVFLDINLLNDVSAEHLVAGFHVSKIKIGKHIR